ncbi:hypothetical protein T10_11217 [Trichinella papuae]|uniref:Uncharacterized protein n=1 Tax=Trichinella papuae TaxID=268474 RepID=A0A0V1MVB2_9BILA|nr:hypothetical protein T10_11217 [Trichinella papuae]
MVIVVLNSQRNGRLTEMTRMNSKVQEIAHKRALLFNKVDRGHCKWCKWPKQKECYYLANENVRPSAGQTLLGLNGNCPSCDKASLFSQCGQTGGQLAACTLELDKRRSRRVGVCDLADPLPHEPLMGTEERRLQNGAGSQRSHTHDVDLCRGVALAILPLHTRLDPQKI